MKTVNFSIQNNMQGTYHICLCHIITNHFLSYSHIMYYTLINLYIFMSLFDFVETLEREQLCL